MDVIEYLEEKAQEIMDCDDYYSAHMLYAQLLGAMKLSLECDLFRDDFEFKKADDLFMQLGRFMVDIQT
ncbi:hypothetical protein [Acinetobacter johnsonii]|uniref:hypothetical protein n=1 Tax=Acinetobacter johnsonii TaxID=40214 RepID=UPI001918DB3F|nr:hypothetical protein [Acinetobacter johnsonii]QQT93771.1 hypothetical protein I6I51_03160 [Acinetobacter johnsonii]